MRRVVGRVAVRTTVTVGLAAATLFTSHQAAFALTGTGRAAAALPVPDFQAVEAEPRPTTVLPVQFASATGAPLTDAELAARSEAAAKLGANASHAAMPKCAGAVAQPNASNGRLDVDDLCVLPWTVGSADKPDGKRLRGDAAIAFARLNAAYFTRFGTDIVVGDTYRSFEEQVETKKRRPGLAAPAGASNHGWALAVDLHGGIESDETEQWKWMLANAPGYGWENPDWARKEGRGPHEPWHWEYAAEVAKVKAAQAQGLIPTAPVAQTTSES